MLSAIYASILVSAFLVSSIAFFGPGGIVIVGLVAVLAAFLNSAKTALRGLLYFMGLLFALLFLLAPLLLPAVSAAREPARRMQCSNNLKQIALAVLDYQEAKNSLPPPYINDENGKPIHSWRVLILPYMDNERLYKQYSFNEPWDGRNNQKLLDARPYAYGCPSVQTTDGKYTNYVAVVGPDCFWSVKEPKDFVDGPLKAKASTTVMLIETDNVDLPWTEPKDLNVADLSTGGLPPPVLISGHHAEKHGTFCKDTHVVNVAMADGSVHSLSIEGISSAKLASMLTIGGCNPEEFSVPKELHVHWLNCSTFAVFVVSTGLLLCQALWYRRKSRLNSPPQPPIKPQ